MLIRSLALTAGMLALAPPACAAPRQSAAPVRAAPEPAAPPAESPPLAPKARAAVAAPAAPTAPSLGAAATGITAAEIEGHVRTLASDAMEGRDTGSPGGLAAASYIEGVLQRAGLRAAGAEGSMLQAIDVRGFRCDGLPELTAIGTDGTAAPAAYGADFVYQGGGAIDATFELLVVRTAADVPTPPRADVALLFAGGGRQRRQWLEQAGAPEGRGFGLLLLPGGGPGAASAGRGTPISDPPHGLCSTDANPPPPTLSVRGPLRERLAGGEVARVHATIRAEGGWPAVNVVGILDGAGTAGHPELAQQAVVISAHYDHLGTAPSGSPPGEAAAPPDLIHNGADDDASGVAAVLALAEAFGEGARRSERPARTLVFLLVTGEERGLLGTSYYLEHPAVPLAQTVCNLNFEMIGRPDPLVGGAGRLWLTGFEHTNLGAAWAAAGLPIAPDPRPEQHFYERSDNYAFVERGIVGQSLSTFAMHTDYHTVRDEVDRLDYAHMETAVRAALAAAQSLADGSLLPEWTPPAEPPPDLPAEVPAATPPPVPAPPPAEPATAPR